jgi:hypothetical protein
MLAPLKLEGMLALLSYMVQEDIQEFQAPRVADECRGALLRAHPFLANVDASSVTNQTYDVWMRELTERYGTWLKVEPLPQGAHEFLHPLDEAQIACRNAKTTVLDLRADSRKEDSEEY